MNETYNNLFEKVNKINEMKYLTEEEVGVFVKKILAINSDLRMGSKLYNVAGKVAVGFPDGVDFEAINSQIEALGLTLLKQKEWSDLTPIVKSQPDEYYEEEPKRFSGIVATYGVM